MSSAGSRIFPATGHKQNTKRDDGDQFSLNHFVSRGFGNSTIGFAFGGRSSCASVSAPWKADSAHPARSDFSGARPRASSSAGEFSSGTKQRTRTITRGTSFGCYSGTERAARAAPSWLFYRRSSCDQHYRRRNLIHRDRDGAGRGPNGRRPWLSHPPLAELALRAPLHG